VAVATRICSRTSALAHERLQLLRMFDLWLTA
jgi:hypothetical protein